MRNGFQIHEILVVQSVLNETVSGSSPALKESVGVISVMLAEGNSTSMCDKGSSPLPIPNSQETIGWWHLPKVELK